jgi:hypothetical protein
VVVVILRVLRLDDDVRLARLAIDVPVVRDEDLVAAYREGEAAVGGAVKPAGPGLAVTRPGRGLRAVARPVGPGGRAVGVVELEPVRTHPGHEGPELAPTGRHDTEALDDALDDGSLAQVERRVGGLRAFLDGGELDDRGDWNTIEFETHEFRALSFFRSFFLPFFWGSLRGDSAGLGLGH